MFLPARSAAATSWRTASRSPGGAYRQLPETPTHVTFVPQSLRGRKPKSFQVGGAASGLGQESTRPGPPLPGDVHPNGRRRARSDGRTVPLPRLCIDALREHRRQQFTERADAWPDWQENGLVSPTRIGTPMEPDNMRRDWTASAPLQG